MEKNAGLPTLDYQEFLDFMDLSGFDRDPKLHEGFKHREIGKTLTSVKMKDNELHGGVLSHILRGLQAEPEFRPILAELKKFKDLDPRERKKYLKTKRAELGRAPKEEEVEKQEVPKWKQKDWYKRYLNNNPPTETTSTPT